ncbi:metal-sulfur cluster assembly factor [Methanocaldococcus sp.]|uniref:metal-sulfur cluster assembly factor n=1 Tax=Methanocaldococcus sp. TaxID=2152917 RepID=UPI00261354EB|nr:metal-sulfur cluster assembly factor [Methanocaldococcus sp.]MCQ6254333.1 metal-sulfur cluster assembly factor [Methanocaldococcus sp.]
MVTKEDVINALKTVADPHVGISIVDMGLVKDIEVDNEGNVKFKLIPTNPACMAILGMAFQAKDAVKSLKGVKNVEVIVEGHLMENEINKMLKEEK